MVSKKTWPDLQACNIRYGRPTRTCDGSAVEAGSSEAVLQCILLFSPRRLGLPGRPPASSSLWEAEEETMGGRDVLVVRGRKLSRKGEVLTPALRRALVLRGGKVTTLARACTRGPSLSCCILLGLGYSLDRLKRVFPKEKAVVLVGRLGFVC